MSNRFYNKIENLCQRIDLYAQKDISVKNEVKTTLYIAKINKLIDMIEKAEKDTYIPVEIIDVKDRIINNHENDKIYNPYSENFYYKEKLQQLNGDINKLIEQLKAEDEIGYRNAYIIQEIEKNVKDNKESGEVANICNNSNKDENLAINHKLSIWKKIKSIFRFRK